MKYTFWDYIDRTVGRFAFIYFLLMGVAMEFVPLIFIMNFGYDMIYIPLIFGPIIIEMIYLLKIFRGYNKFQINMEKRDRDRESDPRWIERAKKYEEEKALFYDEMTKLYFRVFRPRGMPLIQFEDLADLCRSGYGFHNIANAKLKEVVDKEKEQSSNG